MRKALALIFMICLTLALLAAAFVGILLTTLDPNDYKKDISEAVYKATGKQLSLRGNLEISFFPSLALKTGKVTIADPPAFGQEPFLEAEDAALELAVLPLLSKRVEIKEVSLQGVQLKLVETATGQRNWEMGKSTQENTESSNSTDVVALEASTEGKEDKKSRTMDLRIDSASLSDITIVYRNLLQGLSYKLTVTSLELEDIRRDADMKLSFSGLGENMHNGLKAEFALEAMLRVETGGSAKGRITHFETRAEREGTTLATSLAGEFYYDRQSDTFSLDNIQAKANEMSVSGNMTFTIPTPKAPGLGVMGEIALSSADLDSLLAALAAMDKEKTKGRTSSPRNLPVERIAGQERPAEEPSQAELPPGLRNLNADVKITADNLIISKFKLSGLSTRLHAKNGKVEAPFEFALMDGPVTGELEADLKSSTPSFGIKGKAENIPMRDTVIALSGKDYISGPLFSDFSFKAQGMSADELKASLSGSLEAKLAGGEVKGFNLVPQGLANVPAIPVNFPVNSALASAKINKGEANFSVIRLDSPLINITGSGMANIKTNSAYLNMNVSLPTAVSPVIPLIISGPFSSLNCEVNMEQFMKNTARSIIDAPAAGGKILQKLPGETEQLIKGIDGLLRK